MPVVKKSCVKKFDNDSIRQYSIIIQDDHNDYISICDDFLKNTANLDEFILSRRRKKIYKFSRDGRDFVLKIDDIKPKHFENKVWHILRGSFHFRQMLKINKAIDNGCKVVPDLYLVAEESEKRLQANSILLMEYREGKSVRHDEVEGLKDNLTKAMIELHRHGLALGDCNPYNFIADAAGNISVIDLSWQGLTITGQAKDVDSMQRYYGISLPIKGISGKLALFYVRLKRKYRAFRSKVKKH